ELTASRCWQRLVELAEKSSSTDPAVVLEFRRMKDDEDRHAVVFGALHGALTDEDRLVAGESAATLAARMAEAGEFFLPPRRPSQGPVARGGRVFVAHGDPGAEKAAVLDRLLDAFGLEALLQARGRELDRPVTALRVAVKPTFMIGYHRKDRSPITDPVLVTH